MFNFYFGTKEEINDDPKKYLLTIKRMLPRWCNSIPDSEFLALYDIIDELDLPSKPIFVETGSGASTIVLAYFALKTNGELYTWDINGSKLFYLRSVLNDTLMMYFTDKNLNNHWKHIAFNSTSQFIGINMLQELDKKVSVCFLDSEHTLKTLMNEIQDVCNVLEKTAVIAIDDGNLNYKFYHTPYINMIRKKHNLPIISNSSNNVGRYFWVAVGDYLKKRFENVEYLDDNYKKTYQSDIFWSYYKSDRETMNKMSMEKLDSLKHRFDAWKVTQ